MTMTTTSTTARIEAHARSIMMTLAMLFAVIAMAPAHAQGPSDDSWVAPARAGQRANPLMATTDVIKHGQELFHRDCEQCHGKAGRGDGPQSFSLEKHPADLASAKVQAQADGAFFWKMTEGQRRDAQGDAGRQGQVVRDSLHPDACGGPLMDAADAMRRADRRATDTSSMPSATVTAADVASCYCGLYDECPQWDHMTDEERRSCSSDKRATMESLWKTGVREV